MKEANKRCFETGDCGRFNLQVEASCISDGVVVEANGEARTRPRRAYTARRRGAGGARGHEEGVQRTCDEKREEGGG